MNFVVRLGRLDKGANGGRRGVKDGGFVPLNHLPKTACMRVSGYALKHNLRHARGQGAIGHIAVPCDPADISRAPKHITGLHVKRPVHGELGPKQVAASGVLHPLRLTRGARGVQNEQGVLCPHGHRRAFGALAR